VAYGGCCRIKCCSRDPIKWDEGCRKIEAALEAFSDGYLRARTVDVLSNYGRGATRFAELNIRLTMQVLRYYSKFDIEIRRTAIYVVTCIVCQGFLQGKVHSESMAQFCQLLLDEGVLSTLVEAAREQPGVDDKPEPGAHDHQAGAAGGAPPADGAARAAGKEAATACEHEAAAAAAAAAAQSGRRPRRSERLAAAAAQGIPFHLVHGLPPEMMDQLATDLGGEHGVLQQLHQVTSSMANVAPAAAQELQELQDLASDFSEDEDHEVSRRKAVVCGAGRKSCVARVVCGMWRMAYVVCGAWRMSYVEGRIRYVAGRVWYVAQVGGQS